MKQFKATTIVAVNRGDDVCIAGDGQVTMGETAIMKAGAKKVQKIYNRHLREGRLRAARLAHAVPLGLCHGRGHHQYERDRHLPHRRPVEAHRPPVADQFRLPVGPCADVPAGLPHRPGPARAALVPAGAGTEGPEAAAPTPCAQEPPSAAPVDVIGVRHLIGITLELEVAEADIRASILLIGAGDDDLEAEPVLDVERDVLELA